MIFISGMVLGSSLIVMILAATVSQITTTIAIQSWITVVPVSIAARGLELYGQRLQKSTQVAVTMASILLRMIGTAIFVFLFWKYGLTIAEQVRSYLFLVAGVYLFCLSLEIVAYLQQLQLTERASN